jgi:EmrB/QacA subfamily drug resistance transporter
MLLCNTNRRIAPNRLLAWVCGMDSKLGFLNGMNLSQAAARARARMEQSVRGRRGLGSGRAAQVKSVAAPADVAAAAQPARAAMTHAEVRKIFFGLMLAAFLAALNQTIIATALPTIGRTFGDFENLSWIVTAYLLTSTAVAPLYGKLSDIWGRRAMILTAIGLFVAGSAAAAAAPNMTLLILGRALQGIGGGGILPLCQSVIADVVAPRERGRYQAYMGVVWVTSGVFGPVVGGLLAEHFHWSLIFWVNVPLGLGAALLTQIYLRRIPRHDRRHKLDVLGAVLMMGSAIPLLLALTWGGTQYSWLSLPIIAMIGASFVLSFLFGWRLRTAAEPFLPLTVLNNPVMRMGTAAASLSMGVSIGMTIVVPMYFEVAHGLSATESGIALIPLALTTPGSLLSGQAMLYWKHYKRAPMIGLCFALVALAVLVWRPDLPLSYSVAMLGVVGTSIGLVYPITTVSIQNAVPHHQVGIAMGALNFFRSLASAFVVAVLGAILLAGLGVAPTRGGHGVSVVETLSTAGPNMSFVFRWVFLAAFVFLALSLFFLVLMEERPLRTSVAQPEPPTRPVPAE